VADVAVTIDLAEGAKCHRCWRVLPEVGDGDLCDRCDDAVAAQGLPGSAA
jgi:isoleucyl-tRNA synthetase